MEDVKDRFILKSLQRYSFHLLALLIFAFLSLRLYFDFQNFIITALSKIKYTDTISSTSGAFGGIMIFVVLCYRTDYLNVRDVKLKEYYILPLLLSDITCLLISNLIAVVYNNNVYQTQGWVSLNSLNNGMLAAAIIIMKNWGVKSILKKYAAYQLIDKGKIIEITSPE